MSKTNDVEPRAPSLVFQWCLWVGAMSRTNDVEPRAPSLVLVVVLRASRGADVDGILTPLVVARDPFCMFEDCSPLQTVLKILG